MQHRQKKKNGGRDGRIWVFVSGTVYVCVFIYMTMALGLIGTYIL